MRERARADALDSVGSHNTSTTRTRVAADGSAHLAEADARLVAVLHELERAVFAGDTSTLLPLFVLVESARRHLKAVIA